MKFIPEYLLRYFSGKRSAEKGVSLIELCAAVFLLIVITALALDMGILIFASDACDKACKDCARAAGSGRTPGDAINAMNAALAMHSGQLNPLVMSQLTAQLMVYEDYSANTPASTTGNNGPYVTTTASANPGSIPSPSTQTTVWLTDTLSRTAFSPGTYVAVRTTLQATVPAPIFFFGPNIAPNQVQVASVYTYPLTHTYATVLAANSPVLKNPNLANATSANSTNSTNTNSNSTSNSSTTATNPSNTSSNSTSTTSTNNNSTITHANSTNTNSTNTNSTHNSSTNSSGTTSSSTVSNPSSATSTNSTTANSSANSTNTHSNSTTTNSSNTNSTSSNSSNSTNNNSTSNVSTNSTNNTSTNSSTTTTGGGGGGNAGTASASASATATASASATTGPPPTVEGANVTNGGPE